MAATGRPRRSLRNRIRSLKDGPDDMRNSQSMVKRADALCLGQSGEMRQKNYHIFFRLQLEICKKKKRINCKMNKTCSLSAHHYCQDGNILPE